MRNGLIAMVGAGMLLTGTPGVADAGEPMDPPVGVVFMQATLGPATAWPDGTAPRRTSPALARVSRALQDTAGPDEAARGLRQLQYEVRVFGETPRLDLFEGFDIGPVAPAMFGPPTHLEWLTNLTPAAFRSTAPYRSLRDARTLGW